MNTWERNPQDPADEHDWVQYFDDPSKYRDADLLNLIPGDEN